MPSPPPFVLVMGVQRSGTNALFKCLTSDPSVAGYNEAPDNAFFEEVLLRPLEQIRPLLEGRAGALVLKPISETNRRGLGALLAELCPWSPRVVWIYRQPLNCYQSHIERWQGFRERPAEFAEHWSARNRLAIDALAEHGEQIAVVRYEDLIADPQVFASLCGWLDMPGAYLFRPDRGRGEAQSDEVQERIEQGTAQVLGELDEARRFRGQGERPLASAGARALGRLRREWAKLR